MKFKCIEFSPGWHLNHSCMAVNARMPDRACNIPHPLCSFILSRPGKNVVIKMHQKGILTLWGYNHPKLSWQDITGWMCSQAEKCFKNLNANNPQLSGGRRKLVLQYLFRVTLYFKVSFLQYNYIFKYYVIPSDSIGCYTLF